MKNTLITSLIAATALLAGAAQAEVVLVTSKSAGAVTHDQACSAFLGKSGSLTPINMAEGNAARDDFFKKFCEKDAQQVKAIWSKLIFTGKASAKPKEVGSSDEMKKAIAGDANAVGYLDKGAVDGTVKVVN